VGHPRGKQLGGSSAINLLAWTHASQRDIDNWGALGNANWSWESLEPYYKKSERYITPPVAVAADLETSFIEPALHGVDGPIVNGFSNVYTPMDVAWTQTYENLGLGLTADPRSGLGLGGFTNLINVDPRVNERSYAATGYLNATVRARPNLVLVTGALVSKIDFEKGKGWRSEPVATGVTYTVNGTAFSVHAAREVILSAGSFGSPQILELSGIGNPQLLKALGIDLVLANKNVGENLQDHVYILMGFQVNDGTFTLDDFADEAVFNAAYDHFLANGTGPLAIASAGASYLSLSQIVPPDQQSAFFANLSGLVNSGSGSGNSKGDPLQAISLAEQHALSLREALDPTEAMLQDLSVPGGQSPQYSNDTTRLFLSSTPGNFFTILGTLLHPFSRGSVHINSSDPTAYPVIDPRYLSHEADVEVLAKVALHLQEVGRTAPLSGLLKEEGRAYQPGYYTLDETNVREFVRRFVQSEYHPIATCAMLPRWKGGVVDERLRVHGVEGLRVVDASVVPLLPRGNLQTLVYAVAERAAEWILEEYEGGRERGGKKGYGKGKTWWW